METQYDSGSASDAWTPDAAEDGQMVGPSLDSSSGYDGTDEADEFAPVDLGGPGYDHSLEPPALGYDPEDEYRFRVAVPDDANVRQEQFTIGSDWKIPDNPLLSSVDPTTAAWLLDLGAVPGGMRPTLIEYDMNHRWKSDGYALSGTDDSIYRKRTDGDGRGPVQQHLMQGITKKGVHRMLPGMTAPLVDPSDLDPDDIVVRKEINRDNGDGVTFHRAKDAPSASGGLFGQDAIYERYVPGSVRYNGVDRNACYRAGMNVTAEPVAEDGQQYLEVTAENIDSYLRVCQEPTSLLAGAKDSDTLTAAGRANLAKGADAVKATPWERELIWEQEKRMLENLFRDWQWGQYEQSPVF